VFLKFNVPKVSSIPEPFIDISTCPLKMEILSFLTKFKAFKLAYSTSAVKSKLFISKDKSAKPLNLNLKFSSLEFSNPLNTLFPKRPITSIS